MRFGSIHIRWHVALLLFIFALAGCVDPLPGGPGSPINGGGVPGRIELPVSHSTDDGWRETSLGSLRVSLNTPTIWFGGAPGAYDADAFFRWQNVRIPTRATILEARIVMFHSPTTSPGRNKRDTFMDIYGFAYDNLNTFSTSDDPATLRHTQAMVPWDITQRWSDTESTKHETPDLKDIIQEIVNRPGWRAGNALGVIFRTRPDMKGDIYNRSIYTWDAGIDLAPTLVVRYTL